MPDNIAIGEIHRGDSGHVLQSLQRLEHAGTFVCRQINLCNVTGYYALGIQADTRQQHEHLLSRSVL